MTISGPGAGLLTLDAQGTSRVFYVFADTELTLTGITLANGYAAEDGGGIYSAGDLALDDLRFVGNHTDSHGGAIYLDAADATLENVTFTDNSAASGRVHCSTVPDRSHSTW